MLRATLAAALALAACKSAAPPKADEAPPGAALAPAAEPASPEAAPAPAAEPEAPAAAAAPSPAPQPALAGTPARATPAAAATIKEPCKIATKGSSAVARACAEGGIPKAKAIMKAMVKQGRAAGVSYECDDCHNDDGGLTADVKEKFSKLLAVQK